MAPDINLPLVQQALLGPGRIWREVQWLDQVDSTNAAARREARIGLVVAADSQQQGRGRLGRDWSSPPGTSLSVSVTLELPLADSGWLPLLTGLAVAEGIEAVAATTPLLKWPNDVLVPDRGWRKVCGVLCETATSASGSSMVIAGFGLNIEQSPEHLPVPHATSLRMAGAPASRAELLLATVTAVERWYRVMTAGPAGLDELRNAYRRRCATLGLAVRLAPTIGEPLVGTAVAVDDEGRLVLEVGSERSTWSAADVEHLRVDAPRSATGSNLA